MAVRSEAVEFKKAIESYGRSGDMMLLAKYEGELPKTAPVKPVMEVKGLDATQLDLATALINFSQRTPRTDHSTRNAVNRDVKVNLPGGSRTIALKHRRGYIENSHKPSDRWQDELQND